MNILLSIGTTTALLRSSDCCYELCFKRLQKGAETWTPEKYYSTLSQALSAILEMKIRASTATTLSELKKVIEDSGRELRAEYSSKCLIEEVTAR